MDKRHLIRPNLSVCGDLRVLRREVVALREHLSDAQEQVAAARSEAKQLQREAANNQSVANSLCLVPPIKEVRAKLENLVAVDASHRTDVFWRLGDGLLTCISAAVLELSQRRWQLGATCNTVLWRISEPDTSQLSSQARLAQQRQKLLQTHEAICRQTQQLKHLTKQVATPPVSKTQPLEEALQATEQRASELKERLRVSDAAACQLFEMKCHLQEMAQSVQRREYAIEQLKRQQDVERSRRMLLHKKLEFAAADLLKARRLDAEKTWSRRPQVLSEVLHVAVGIHVDSTHADDTVDCSTLRTRLEELHADKEALEQRTNLEVRHMRDLVRGGQHARGGPVFVEASAEEEVDNHTQYFDIGSEPDDPSDKLLDCFEADLTSVRSPTSSCVLYAQKIEQLEHLNQGLQHDVQLVQGNNWCLQEDSWKKDHLILRLLQSSLGSCASGGLPHPLRASAHDE